MKVPSIIRLCLLTGLILYSCARITKYPNTYDYVQAEFNPRTAELAANVQMVLVAGREYRDSILFRLNPGFEIHALTAQELERYIFDEADPGILKLYIEEFLQPGEQLHISMSYSGSLSDSELSLLDPSMAWLPQNKDTEIVSLLAKLSLPGGWRVERPDAASGEHGKWLIEPGNAGSLPEIILAKD